jgi:hypothetical protein
MLQELVPNGTKVDLVTMLEKAISYLDDCSSITI